MESKKKKGIMKVSITNLNVPFKTFTNLLCLHPVTFLPPWALCYASCTLLPPAVSQQNGGKLVSGLFVVLPACVHVCVMGTRS